MDDDHGREAIDFGGGVTGYWMGWSPDRSIPSNAERYAGIADIEKCSLQLGHNKPTGERHEGIITVEHPGSRQVFPEPHALWQVQSWEPLTLTPSVHCSCGWHGFIRGGRWVPV